MFSRLSMKIYLFAIFIFSCSEAGPKVELGTSVDLGMEETENGSPLQRKQILIKPLGNKIYHAAFPDFGGSEDQVSAIRMLDFETLVEKPITWAYFSNNWSREKGIHFPSEEVKVIHDFGRLPFIRLMARANFDEGGPDPILSVDVLLSGEKDEELSSWARKARDTGIPLLAEFGTEVNGDWFPWNAKWNGAEEKSYGDTERYDGMEKFRDLYRKIIDICRAEGAFNITWFFHVDAYSLPKKKWNTMAGYYPGDDYIDWIGISTYGPQRRDEGWWSFKSILDDNWEEIRQISPAGKPMAILEWGVVEGEAGKKATWIEEAMETILPGGAYENQFSAVSYWHENFDESQLRVDTHAQSLSAYRHAIQDDIFVSEARFE